jgi:hypothetical protein
MGPPPGHPIYGSGQPPDAHGKEAQGERRCHQWPWHAEPPCEHTHVSKLFVGPEAVNMAKSVQIISHWFYVSWMITLPPIGASRALGPGCRA